jgi:ABC-type glycerol-3-phosphate transport system substrate-binding protein
VSFHQIINILQADVRKRIVLSTATAPNRLIEAARSHIADVQPQERDGAMKSRQRYGLRYRPIIAVAAVAGVIFGAAACTSSSSSSTASNTSAGSTGSSSGPVTISIDCAPTAAQDPIQHKEWVEDVAIFEKANPKITIDSVYNYPCESPPTFTAMLRAGTETNLFYTYFTDLPQVLTAGQAADITPYVNTTTVPNLDSIVPGAMNDVTAGKSIYGIPFANYTQGLIYNRKLFSEAGLNPNDPPTTWAQVETDATAIAKLGNGIEGWGDYSADNNGGWHFASYMDALGGSVVNNATDPPTANFDNADGMAILTALHNLRFTDNAMSATQGLGWGALQAQFGAGKLGMYIAAPDDVYDEIITTDKGNINDIGMGPLPSVTGTAAGSLSGGDDYMFAKNDTPAQIEAGIKFLNFEDLTPGDGQFNYTRQKADGLAVGFPEPLLFTGSVESQIDQLRSASSTINIAYYQPYISANEASDGEPTDAQAVYKSLDPTMLAVLTERNANIPGLLKQAATNVNDVLQFVAG